MLHEKIQSTIALIEDVVDNRQKENDNANAAKRNSTFFDSLTKLTPSLTSYVLARKKFNFSLQSNTATDLQYLMNYSKQTFDNLKAVSPGNFKQKSETFIASISKEWETFYKANISELINNLNIIVLVHPEPNVVRSCIAAIKKCILSSNIKGNIENVIRVNYASLICEDSKLSDNSTMMLLNLLEKCGVKKIMIAGFDGLKPNEDNYVNSDFINSEHGMQFEESNRIIRK